MGVWGIGGQSCGAWESLQCEGIPSLRDSQMLRHFTSNVLQWRCSLPQQEWSYREVACAILTVVMFSSAHFAGLDLSVSSSLYVTERSDIEGVEVKERLLIL